MKNRKPAVKIAVIAAIIVLIVISAVAVNRGRLRKGLDSVVDQYRAYITDIDSLTARFGKYTSLKEGKLLYGMHRELQSGDYKNATADFLQYKKSGGKLPYDCWVDLVMRQIAEIEDPVQELDAWKNGYAPAFLKMTEEDSDAIQFWYLSSLSERGVTLLGCDGPGELLSACGGNPGKKVLVWDSRSGAIVSAMAMLDPSLWPDSPDEVGYVLKLDFSETNEGGYIGTDASAYRRHITVSLVDLTGGAVLYSETLDGGDPPKQAYAKEGQEAKDQYGPMPSDKDILATVNAALNTIGTGITVN